MGEFFLLLLFSLLLQRKEAKAQRGSGASIKTARGGCTTKLRFISLATLV